MKAPSERHLVAVSQRVVEIPAYGEFRDTLDQAWTVWLHACGFDIVPVPNRLPDPVGFVDRLGVDGLILSGGNNLAMDVYEGVTEAPPDAYQNRDQSELALLEHAAGTGLPVLGYCHGMHVIQAWACGRLVRVDGSSVRHVAATHDVAISGARFRDLADAETIEVNSFHNYGLRREHMTPDWSPFAISEPDGVIEGFAHRKLPIAGMQWHPERRNSAAEFDRRLIRSWFSRRAEQSCEGDNR